MPSMDTKTILEPSALESTKDGIYNNGFNETDDHEVDKSAPLHHPKRSGFKLWRWQIEGIGVVILSVVVASVALTLALIITILVGEPQVKPHGVVLSQSAQCNLIGLKIMKDGRGNAVDSAVATALCMAVVRPDVASFAGCGMMLVENRNGPTSWLYDFMCPAPSRPSPVDKNKPGTLVGIPGFVRGLRAAHRQFGKLRWSELFTGLLALVAEGFQPDPKLVAAAKATAAANPGASGMVYNDWAEFSGSVYYPPDALKMTLLKLKSQEEKYFYEAALDPNSFTTQIVSYLNGLGLTWDAQDMTSYAVQRPKAVSMGFAGFTLQGFPAPSTGGPFLLSLLGNLWLKSTRNPLNQAALAQKVPNATATALHRWLELSKLSETHVLTLGDITDASVGTQAKAALDHLLDFQNRISIVDSVSDIKTSPPQPEISKSPNFDIGDTGIVTTDSDGLTVTMNLFLGSPFGSGLYVPNTGVHLNAALRLFSVDADPAQLNKLGPNRRPLVPISPIYLSSTHRKCGVRVGITSSGGLWGTIDAAQIIFDAALFLRTARCKPPKGAHITAEDSTVVPVLVDTKSTASQSSKHIGYTPASDAFCLDLQKSTDLSRIRSGPYQAAGPMDDFVTTEPGFNPKLLEMLLQVGHQVTNISDHWPGRVASTGWNGYAIVSSMDSDGSWNLTSF